MTAPCKDCPDRHPGCHSKCEKYIEYDTERKKYLADKLKKSQMYNDSRYYRNVRTRHTGRSRWPE